MPNDESPLLGIHTIRSLTDPFDYSNTSVRRNDSLDLDRVGDSPLAPVSRSTLAYVHLENDKCVLEIVTNISWRSHRCSQVCLPRFGMSTRRGEA